MPSFIKISKERFPKIYATRQHIKDGSDYFGRFASLRLMNTLLDLVKILYPIRNCNLLLTETKI